MAYSIEVPAGDPDSITSTADRLGKIATDLGDHGEMITGEQSGITGAWKDANGQAAATEAGNLSSKSKEFAGHATTASNALRTFASALKTAQDEIRGLQGQLEEARQAAAGEASHNSIINSPTSSQADKDYTRQSIDASHMQPIIDKVDSKHTELMQADRLYRTAYLMKGGVAGYLDLTNNGKILGAFGHMISAGTGDNSPAPLPQRYIDSLLSPLDKHDIDGRDAAWALSQIMEGAGNPPLGRRFLDQAGDKLYPLEEALSTPDAFNPYLDSSYKRVVPSTNYAGVDPSAWYFTALGKNAPASQDFFAHSDRADFYLTGRGTNSGWDYPDNGQAIASAMRSATTTQIRTGPGAEASAVAAMNIVNGLSKNQEADWLTQPGHKGLLDASGDILVSYAHDINGSFDEPPAPRQNGHALFDRTNLMNTMRESFGSEDNYNRVLSAVGADDQQRLLHSVDGQNTYVDARYAYNDALDTTGRSLGAVYAARKGFETFAGSELDDSNKIADKGLSFVMGHTVGNIPVIGPAINDAYGFGGGDLLFPDDHQQKALMDGLHGRDKFSQSYDDDLTPAAAQQRMQQLWDAQPNKPEHVTLSQDILQAKQDWKAGFDQWSGTTWDEDNGNLKVPEVTPGK